MNEWIVQDERRMRSAKRVIKDSISRWLDGWTRGEWEPRRQLPNREVEALSRVESLSSRGQGVCGVLMFWAKCHVDA